MELLSEINHVAVSKETIEYKKNDISDKDVTSVSLVFMVYLNHLIVLPYKYSAKIKLDYYQLQNKIMSQHFIKSFKY